MTIIPSTMTVLIICGCWRPPSWSISFFKRFAYNLYTIFVAFLISSLSLSQAIGVILNEDDSNDSSDVIYVFLAEAISCFKMLCLLINRNNIVNLISSLTEEPYKPSNEVETRIQTEFDELSRFNTHSYAFLISLSSQEIVHQIFDTNLVGLNDDMKKCLLIMMNRTTRPIVFIVMNLFPLNLDSFVKILKTAYTAYNFLAQTQEE
ncbi:uncharacterized protein LOC122514374 isoform X2 [Polistes fuscatus]|uniref:uncharacterized protein LOC122514374 isoform X2 n=1 Tax=Polistes fuscatus TaxID=30207 RepID=UPI001CA8ED6F|nr:uncharacterized protein LOC122514374 isoform X2 [Polistes fuscatus]